MKQVKGYSNLVKSNGAILNTDRRAYEKAKKIKEEKQRLDNIENRLDKITELLERVLLNELK